MKLFSLSKSMSFQNESYHHFTWKINKFKNKIIIIATSNKWSKSKISKGLSSTPWSRKSEKNNNSREFNDICRNRL